MSEFGRLETCFYWLRFVFFVPVRLTQTKAPCKTRELKNVARIPEM